MIFGIPVSSFGPRCYPKPSYAGSGGARETFDLARGAQSPSAGHFHRNKELAPRLIQGQCPRGVGIRFERTGDFPIKLPENFCGAFGFLCYIHALSNGIGFGQPYETMRVSPWQCTSGLTVTTKKKIIKKAPGKPAGKEVGSATAASILGGPGPVAPSRRGSGNGAIKIKAEWAKYYDTLLELRERLLNQMSGLAKESAEEMPGYSLHMADSGTDNFDRDFALSLLSSDQDAIYEIEEALKRIERDTYGICELTGKAIPRARLDAIPWTRFTVEAQAQLEKEGALRQRRLGTLGSVDSAGAVEVEEEEEAEEKPAKEKE